VISRKINAMVMVSLNGRTEESMKANGLEESNMVRDCIKMEKEKKEGVNGQMVKESSGFEKYT
jgi:hypothetical protein